MLTTGHACQSLHTLALSTTNLSVVNYYNPCFICDFCVFKTTQQCFFFFFNKTLISLFNYSPTDLRVGKTGISQNQILVNEGGASAPQNNKSKIMHQNVKNGK